MLKSDDSRFGSRGSVSVNPVKEFEREQGRRGKSRQLRSKHQYDVYRKTTPRYGGNLSWLNDLDLRKYRHRAPTNTEGRQEVAIAYPVHAVIGPSAQISEDEKLVLERTMNQLGYLDRSYMNIPSDGVSAPLTGAIQRFQSEHDLEPDGIMLENGPTAHALGNAMVKILETRIAANSEETSDEEQCEHLYWNVDVPTCNQITLSRGREAGGRCHHSAAMRFASCLNGTPIDALPPLDTWVWP